MKEAGKVSGEGQEQQTPALFSPLKKLRHISTGKFRPRAPEPPHTRLQWAVIDVFNLEGMDLSSTIISFGNYEAFGCMTNLCPK